jgi:hypothetical protein
VKAQGEDGGHSLLTISSYQSRGLSQYAMHDLELDASLESVSSRDTALYKPGAYTRRLIQLEIQVSSYLNPG